MPIINICYDCLTGKDGNVFFKAEKNNVFRCEKCTDNSDHKYYNVSLEEAIKVKNEYLTYINKVKLIDTTKNKIKDILNNRIKDL
jgi:hypothetical protein